MVSICSGFYKPKVYPLPMIKNIILYFIFFYIVLGQFFYIVQETVTLSKYLVYNGHNLVRILSNWWLSFFCFFTVSYVNVGKVKFVINYKISVYTRSISTYNRAQHIGLQIQLSERNITFNRGTKQEKL